MRSFTYLLLGFILAGCAAPASLENTSVPVHGKLKLTDSDIAKLELASEPSSKKQSVTLSHLGTYSCHLGKCESQSDSRNGHNVKVSFDHPSIVAFKQLQEKARSTGKTATETGEATEVTCSAKECLLTFIAPAQIQE
ncbi:MAG: hypothetical protein R3B54_02425 [Bdellovibrionota bacterium]